jgi:hypothetical protein
VRHRLLGAVALIQVGCLRHAACQIPHCLPVCAHSGVLHLAALLYSNLFGCDLTYCPAGVRHLVFPEGNRRDWEELTEVRGSIIC